MTRQVAWPAAQRVYLSLDFECDYGTALNENYYQAAQQVDRLVAVLEEFETPLTCFVQTELLDKHPELPEALRHATPKVTFHPHSHTHTRRDETSVRREVQKSTERYQAYFGERPIGYRFPNGNVREADYRLLSDHDYAFDTSVFPSWRPNCFNNVGAMRIPTYRPAEDVYEYPFTVYSDLIPIPTALSYCQLLGRPYTSLLTHRPPPIVVLNLHMHDLVTPSTVSKLSPLYRAIYSRNPDGLPLLRHLLRAFDEQGYAFDTLDNAHRVVSDG